MNKKGTRATNGEGYVGTTVQKVKKKFDNSKMCKTCENCKDRSKCNGRKDWAKCDLCRSCKEECLKYCDRFYCRKIVQAQITVNGKQITVANKKNRKEAVEQKKKEETNIENGYYIAKNNITLYQICKKIESEKLKANIITESSVYRNLYVFKRIENSSFYTKPIQKITKSELEDFFNTYKYLSQSELDKLINKINEGFSRAVDDGIVSYTKNPMKNIKHPISDKVEKEVEAFELDEVHTLLKYVLTHDNLISTSKCNYDSQTIRNIIILSLLSLTRIGELCAIDITKHIDFDKKALTVERTLTKNAEGKVLMGKTTKTGKRVKKTRKRSIDFKIFSEELFELVLKDQVAYASNNKNNNENLLFSDKNGNYIKSTSITNIFKRICREAKVKLDLPAGCHIHMTRHTRHFSFDMFWL